MYLFVYVALLIGSLGALAYLYLSWNFGYWKERGVKGPEPVLLYGNLPSVVGSNRNMALEMQDLYEMYKNTRERFIGIFVTRKPEILVVDPGLARDVMVTHFRNFRVNEPSFWVNRRLEKVAGMNPFFSPVEHWKERRMDIVAGLSTSKLRQAYPIVQEICGKMLDYLNTTIDSGEQVIETKTLCYSYTLEILADFLWGFNADAFGTDGTSNALMQFSRKMLDSTFPATKFYHFSKVAQFLRNFSPYRYYGQDTDDFFSNMQKEAMALRLKNKTDRPDFLNFLLRLREKRGISLVEMVGHSLTVVLDGFETTALVMYHTLFYLANNQKAQQKLRSEITTALEAEGGISFDTLMDLPYLSQCFDETTRMVTPIPIYSRICSETIHLNSSDGNSVRIDPGMVVHIPSYAFHHDSETFPQPDEYIPERFDENRAKDLHQEGRFIPFGNGPRTCAGMKFGHLEARAGLCEIVRHFQLNVSEKVGRPEGINPTAFTLGLSGDINIEFQRLAK